MLFILQKYEKNYKLPSLRLENLVLYRIKDAVRYLRKCSFVKYYSNFDPKLRPSARTKIFLAGNSAFFEVFRKLLSYR